MDIVLHPGKTPYEDEGRDQGVAFIGQGIPKVACKAPEAKLEAWNRFSHSPQREPTLPTL